ncbi:glycosyltransferase [Polynucleobacter paneuropaeus]|nr:glycosyltransferase [Polynucleobacter paneuropaeus]
MPSISIGIAVLNGASHIRDLLESLKSQYSGEMQIIILDGGSTDGTQAIIKEYIDIVSHYESKPDGGIYDAYNSIRGIASGDYLLYLGCDDRYVFGKLSDINLFLNRDFIYYGNVLMTKRGNFYDGYFSKFKMIRKNICHQSIFYPRLVYKKFAYDLSYPALSDYEYNLRLMSKGYKFIHFDHLVTIFSNGGLSSRGDEVFDKNKFNIVLNYFGVHYAIYFMVYKVIRVLFRKFFNK